MEATEVLEKVDQRITDHNTEIDQKFAEFAQKFEKADSKPEDKAEMARGPLEGVTNLTVWDVPVGQALVGGFTAVMASELVDGFFKTQQPMTLGIIKLATAGIAVKWGGRLLGDTGAKALAIILAYDGLRQILPIDEWAGRLVGGVTTRAGAGLAGKAGMRKETPLRVIREAEEVASNYYAGLSG